MKTQNTRRVCDGRFVVELMETYLDLNRKQDDPEQPPEEPRCWMFSARTVWVDTKGGRKELQTHIHIIDGENLNDAVRQLNAFTEGKVFTKDEW